MADKREILSLSEAMEGLPEDFAFFADRFTGTIQPALAGREAERVKAVQRQWNFIVIGVVLGVAIFAGFTFLMPEDGMMFGGFIGVGAALAMGAWGSMALDKLGKETKLMLVEPVAQEFNIAYQVAPGRPEDVMQFRSLDLVPGWDREKFEDRLTGARNDTCAGRCESSGDEDRQARTRCADRQAHASCW